MRDRIVIPELLDSLPHDAPDAVRNRRDIRLIHGIMGGLRWTAARVRDLSTPDTRWIEIGAGDGPLAAHLGSAPGIHLTGADLIPPPEGWRLSLSPTTPRTTLLILALAALSHGLASPICAQVDAGDREIAFPGAEGFGKYAKGGRGGHVIEVTNLNDKGPGSLRAALDTPGPRIVVFKVGGTIELSNTLKVREPFLTIDGSTAPAPGITLKNGGLFFIGTHDIIIRYLRLRPGASLNDQVDGLTLSRCQRVMVDHCSMSWSTDEVLDIGDWADEGGRTHQITVQWCFITEALNDSTHDKGEHGLAALISNFEDGRVSLHHNLFAHHVTRMPRPGGQDGKPGLLLDFRNNVLYDWVATAGYGSGVVRMNYVGNYLKAGPSTVEKCRLRVFQPIGPDFKLFLQDNAHADFADARLDNRLLLKLSGNETDPSPYLADSAFPVEEIAPETAETAAGRVLAGAGANLPIRDAVDLRIVEQYRTRTGKIIDSPGDVGGWPNLAE